MADLQKPYILTVDDDLSTLKIIEKSLTAEGYQVLCLQSAREALEQITLRLPELILLDILMPEMGGYEFCAFLQKEQTTSRIPVIFLSALKEEKDKANAFAVGAADYLVKPIDKALLLQKVRLRLQMNARWQKLPQDFGEFVGKTAPSKFIEFKKSLIPKFDLPSHIEKKLSSLRPDQIYSLAGEAAITGKQISMHIAEFLHLPYLPLISPDDILLGILPKGFCQTHSIIPLKGKHLKFAFALSNPFDWELTDALRKFSRSSSKLELLVLEEEKIESFFKEDEKEKPSVSNPETAFFRDADKKIDFQATPPTREEIEEAESAAVLSQTHSLLEEAVAARASDIHIDPKEDETVIRLRVDGDMTDFRSLEKSVGNKMISRFKALAEMDIAERRKPQDGSVEVLIDRRKLKLRLATTSTPSGESLIMRILDPNKRPKRLEDLGMSPEQVMLVNQFITRAHGLILLVGPTGAGKTTTIYSLLSQIDCQTRSLISVEDPVEYRIPFANQQQVHNKAGVTFEALLKSSVRQDPDILFIGEVRDPNSAKIAMDFASTGHLTITTMHTSNATTAIFRLERLEMARTTMADSILAIIAQRLLKKLCPHCKTIEPITQEESDLLAPFTQDIPAQLARAVGCSACNQTGYAGREAIYEVIHCNTDVAEMIRSNQSISQIRQFIHQRGDQLISDRAVERIRNLTCSLKDVYATILAEESALALEPSIPKMDSVVEESPKSVTSDGRILLVEDDQATQKVVTHILEKEGYQVVVADDGVDALVKMGQTRFGLILSDINVPNLDGYRLLEMVQQKGFGIPIILMTGRISAEDEIKGLELGAVDYLRKPVQKELLLLRVRKALPNHFKSEMSK